MKNREIIGVDLGGTNMRAGLVADGDLKEVASTGVPKTDDWQEVMAELLETIGKVWNSGIEGIGIGVPGLVDAYDGVVYNVQNIPSWKTVRVRKIVSEEFGVPVYVNNDANCFAVGERFFGAGQAYEDFVGLITGTGLGAGIIKWGRLLQDQNCGSGEFGMLPYLDGIYEDYCSGQFFIKHSSFDGKTVADLAAKGDKDALAAFKSYGLHLANVIKVVLFTIDPKAIIIGGSVALSFPYYEEAMRAELSSFPYPKVIERLQILPSGMPEIAILGAAALVLDKM
ncbi:MAG TPA: sugar kinase [Marinilabiliaceae bacterium]|nr:sugar kinase [Marinilabiliaceae bacterium]HBX88431.1 sugar kinase [Marinilabiliaceae bacterium]